MGEERSLGLLERRRVAKQRPDQGAQKPLEPAQEQPEVVAGRGEHGVDVVAVAAFEVIAPHPVLGLDVPNDRLDYGAAAHLAADRGGDAADLAADPDAELLCVVVAAIALVDVNAEGVPTDYAIHGVRGMIGRSRMPMAWQPPGDRGAIRGVAVSDEIARCLIPWECFGDLLGDPLRGWVCSHIGPDEPSPLQTQDDQPVEQFEPDRRHDEQIDAGDAGGVIAQESLPAWRAWAATP